MFPTLISGTYLECIGDSFRVNLYRPSYNQIQKSIPETTPKSVLKNLNKTQQKIVDIIMKNPKVTQAEIAAQLDVSLSAVKKSMKEIVKIGVLVRVGANKGGYWEVVDK